MSDSRSGECRLRIVAAAVLLMSLAGVSFAQDSEGTSSDLAQMRREIEELRDQLRELRDQIAALSRSAAAPAGSPAGLAFAPAAPDASDPLPAAPEVPIEPAQPFQPVRAAAGSNAFNPAISAVFQGIAGSSVNNDRDEDGFQLSEAEIGLQAAVDPFARVDLFVAFGTEGEAEVEEGYITFPALAGGLQARAGRFKEAFGKWNPLHDHQFLTVDRPDALTLFLGEEGLVGDGASLSWLVPGTGSVYLESVTEVASTGNEVSFNARRRDPLFLQRLSSVFTLTPNATLQLGASYAHGRAGASQELLEDIDAAGLSGMLEPSDRLASNLFGADVTYKWKPLQFNVYRSFTWQTEAIASRRQIESFDPGGLLLKDRVRSIGGFSHVEYQFAKRWRAGLRYDVSEFPDEERARLQAISGVLRILPTEFQEFRIQFKHTGRNPEAAARFDGIRSDNEIFIEWIPAIGAHAAHAY